MKNLLPHLKKTLEDYQGMTKMIKERNPTLHEIMDVAKRVNMEKGLCWYFYKTFDKEMAKQLDKCIHSEIFWNYRDTHMKLFYLYFDMPVEEAVSIAMKHSNMASTIKEEEVLNALRVRYLFLKHVIEQIESLPDDENNQ